MLGSTKRIAERLTAARRRPATTAPTCRVRFGNVLGSRGSVLGAFHAQIEMGGPITVTDPDVTRYFMTVEEAVQLVIQAGAIGESGEALVLDMGEPVRIADVARRLADQADRPIEIVYTGLRPGEKLHEVLQGGRRGPAALRPPAHRPWSTSPPLDWSDITGLCSNDADTLLRGARRARRRRRTLASPSPTERLSRSGRAGTPTTVVPGGHVARARPRRRRRRRPRPTVHALADVGARADRRRPSPRCTLPLTVAPGQHGDVVAEHGVVADGGVGPDVAVPADRDVGGEPGAGRRPRCPSPSSTSLPERTPAGARAAVGPASPAGQRARRPAGARALSPSPSTTVPSWPSSHVQAAEQRGAPALERREVGRPVVDEAGERRARRPRTTSSTSRPCPAAPTMTTLMTARSPGTAPWWPRPRR